LSRPVIFLIVNPLPPDQASAAEEAQWFTQEVHPHESSLRAYLRGSFPAVRDVDDVIQESYLRILRRSTGQRIASAKAFLFTVARRLALDHLRHNRRSPIETVGELAALGVVEDRASIIEIISEEEKIRLLGQAIGSLPTRCREIIFLHKIKGLSQREVAVELRVSEKIVEHDVAVGVKRCQAYFRRFGITSF